MGKRGPKRGDHGGGLYDVADATGFDHEDAANVCSERRSRRHVRKQTADTRRDDGEQSFGNVVGHVSPYTCVGPSRASCGAASGPHILPSTGVTTIQGGATWTRARM